jgi:hypothetical protein
MKAAFGRAHLTQNLISGNRQIVCRGFLFHTAAPRTDIPEFFRKLPGPRPELVKWGQLT